MSDEPDAPRDETSSGGPSHADAGRHEATKDGCGDGCGCDDDRGRGSHDRDRGHDHDEGGYDRDHDHSDRSSRRGRGEEAIDEAGETGEELRLSVPAMDCASCAGKVESSVARLDGALAIDPRPTSGTLLVRYDPDETTPEAVRERVTAAGYDVEEGRTETFDVPEMDCASCAGKVENALTGLDGVVDVDPRPTTGSVVVTFDPTRTGASAVVATIESAGYEVRESEGRGAEPAVWRSRRALKTGLGGVLLLLGVLFEWVGALANPTLATVGAVDLGLDWALYVAAVAVAGVPVLRNGYYSLRNRNLDIDLLMGAGILGALAVNLPFEAATLAVLFSVAELLERFSMDRARDSLRELMELSPDTATVLREGEERTVPAAEVAVGETVVVRPGERVPLDGIVSEGASAVDESPITGESVPVDKATGDEVFAGSINEEGYLEVEATAPADESTLAQVIDLVEDAQANKTEHERFVDRFARYYTPVIVAGAVATALVPPLLFGAPFERWFVRGLTLLVVACPCAFVISTPVSVVSGITAAARNGVLVKGGDHLEAAGAVEAVALDKTGTITTGDLGVTDVIALNGNDEDDVLACARAVETRSEHPIAEAIVAHAAERGVADREVTAFEAITGKGVRADLDGRTHYAGKPGLFADLGFDLEHIHVATDGGRSVGGGSGGSDDAPDGPAEATLTAEARDCKHDHGSYLDLVNETIPRLQAEGKSVVLVGTEDELEGVVAIADTVRPEAAWVVSRLRDLGVKRVVMLTGDNERTARVIGQRVGVDEVRADLLPEEKVAAVEALGEEYAGVAMVGDGVNDAPALATATVGVAMGAAGTDAALETADVALMGDDLTRLPYLYDLSRRATRIIRQNIWASLAVKAVLAAGAPLGYVSVIAAIVVGDMGMSLGVTSNALRLAGVDPTEPDEPTAEGVTGESTAGDPTVEPAPGESASATG